MPRIPDDEIRRIKAEVPIRSYLEGRGCEFRRHGADIVCPCPFPDHDDSTPSFIVSEAKNVYHCPGCGQKGTILDLVMGLEGVSFRHAVELLREGLPALARDGRRYTTVRRLASPVSVNPHPSAVTEPPVFRRGSTHRPCPFSGQSPISGWARPLSPEGERGREQLATINF